MTSRPRAGSGTPPRTAWWAGVSIVTLCLAGMPTEAAPGRCPVASEHEGVVFQVGNLPPEWFCPVSAIIDRYTTIGLIGPARTPTAPALYHYLVDRPTVTAELVRRLGIAPYQASPRGRRQFWANDGEGTQALLTILLQTETTRIYHLEGYHQGRIFPLIRGKAVIFMLTDPAPAEEGPAAVETTLVVYTQVENPILSKLVYLLRPLVATMVTRKVTKGIDAANQLSLAIAENPERVAHVAGSLTSLDPAERQSLQSYIRSAGRLTAHSRPARPLP